jgi:hypothetical protein
MVVWADAYVKALSRGGVRGAVLAIGENVQLADATLESIAICVQ